jgi:serine/threonine-protein kinase
MLLSGLSAVHAAGFVHRDVKPGNVLLAAALHDGRVEVKLTDFGVAVTLRKALLATVGGTKRVTGTVPYMSPEHIEGERPVTFQSDVFSVGSMLFEMLTGRLPFGGEKETDEEVMRRIREEPAADVRQFAGDVPQLIAGVVSRCMRKIPEERFASALEAKQALQAAKAGR